MNAPLALTDRQLRMVEQAARSLPLLQRDEFLTAVARHLAAEPTDEAVVAALNAQLDRLRVFNGMTQ
jgi:hypothetical protein